MPKRVSQTTAVNGPICIGPDGRTITRCVDCADHHKCSVCAEWPWPYGPISRKCELPRAEERE